MRYYKTCPECGSHLDPGEHCDCDKEENTHEERNSGENEG